MIADLLTTTSLTLRKLSLSHLDLRTPSILEKFFKVYAKLDVTRRNALRKLKLGNLTIMDNSTLNSILPHLEQLEGLETVSLFGNVKLGSGLCSGLKRFLGGVGRNCMVRELFQSSTEIRG
jgi:hypothetical protein